MRRLLHCSEVKPILEIDKGDPALGALAALVRIVNFPDALADLYDVRMTLTTR